MSDQPISLAIEFDPVIEWNGGSYDAIELREPKIREIEAALGVIQNKSDAQSMVRYQIALITGVSGKPKQVIEQMKVSDVNKAFDYLTGFSNPSPATTEK
jgi:hypothetical protein